MNPSVNFLYKAMRERDPRKRRVKPVSDDMVQVNFGLGDSDEDSDFDIGKLNAGGKKSKGSRREHVEVEDDEFDTSSGSGSDEDEENIVTGDEQELGSAEDQDDSERNNDEEDDDDDEDEDMTDDSEDEGDLSDDEGEDDDEMEDEEEDEDDSDEELASPKIKGLGHVWNMIDSDEDDEDYVPRKKKKKISKTSKKSENPPSKSMKPSASVAREESPGLLDADMASPQATGAQHIKVLVCCVCLSDRSADDDEIVECDNCGVSVHEGCYGISESHSTASTESSASTEPWFCDACKANAKPVCELCPNSGGIYKETDNGKWVHIVCALYTPGVAFGDVDKLTLVTLFEMPYSKWGARECSLCEDSRFSQTGVCINCDAGMCKACFHVTCAQREGLLAEASPEDVLEVADPFFAYCKLHADKLAAKVKRRNWLAIQSHMKNHSLGSMTEGQEKARFQRKLSRHRDKYSQAKLRRPPTWLPKEKMVRHLHTSPSALRAFLRKAELMGVASQAAGPFVPKQEVRKVPGQPQFSADFIAYFLERNVKVDSLKSSQRELNSQNIKLQRQERQVRSQYEKLQGQVNQLREAEVSLTREGESLCGMLGDIYGKPLTSVPEVFRGGKKRGRAHNKREPVTEPQTLIHQCGVCQQTSLQHLLAHCDSCRKHYHLACLDPPLSRMPKKTKLFGWQCSFCTPASSGDEVKAAPPEVVNEPRRLRETIKGPDKYFHLHHIQDSLKSQEKKSLLNKRSRQRRKIRVAKTTKTIAKVSPSKRSPQAQKKLAQSPAKRVKASPGEVTAGSSSSSKKSTESSGGVAKGAVSVPLFAAADLPITCVVCNQDGTASDTVRCDECLLSYHLGCLDPPVKKSPKRRGYAWHCEACDQMSNSDSDMGPRRERRRENSQQEQRPSGREASNHIVFDVDVSSDDEDYSL